MSNRRVACGRNTTLQGYFAFVPGDVADHAGFGFLGGGAAGVVGLRHITPR
jgi:hypothetical protein